MAAAGGPFRAAFASGDARVAAAIREAIAEWGPYPRLEIRDKDERGIVLATDDPRALAGLIDGLRRLRDTGFPGAHDAAEAIMHGFPGA